MGRRLQERIEEMDINYNVMSNYIKSKLNTIIVAFNNVMLWVKV